eukprot:402794-Prorocentrum_lima.AAC.1
MQTSRVRFQSGGRGYPIRHWVKHCDISEWDIGISRRRSYDTPSRPGTLCPVVRRIWVMSSEVGL